MLSVSVLENILFSPVVRRRRKDNEGMSRVSGVDILKMKKKMGSQAGLFYHCPIARHC
jgi:hypothetical protein